MKHPRIRKTTWHPVRLALAIVAGLVLFTPTAASAVALRQKTDYSRAFTEAAAEFRVPEEILLAVSYNQSRWESHKGQMSLDGGYGPMHLRTKIQTEDARGDTARPLPAATVGASTLDRAAQLLGTSADSLKTDAKQNIRGGAAVLADRAKQLNGGTLPSNAADWYGTVADYSGSPNQAQADSFADDVYDTIKKGVTRTTSEGQQLSLQASSHMKAPNRSQSKKLGLFADPSAGGTNRAECPSTITCRFVPAAYGANSADPADYGNYDHSNRPHDMKVKYIVIHDTEGSYNSAISWFQTTQSYVSAHYVIRSSDGEVTQMVDTKDTAWHAGDWYVNMHSIGIEHEGVAAEGGVWYTEAMYRSSAKLVRYLAKKYNIPLDRDHIIGHDNVPGLTDARVPRMHWDPGPYWDWRHYIALVRAEAPPIVPVDNYRGNVVTIKPTFAQNILTVQDCSSGTCVDLTGPSNFVYLRTEPRSDAPLITDPLLHPDGSPGSTRIGDWTAKAATGQQYAVADRQGDWMAIWFAGQKAWIYDPPTQSTVLYTLGRTVKLKPGLAETNVYGGAYPESSVYPADVPGPAQPKLSYKIKAGQKYVSYGKVPTDYFYDATIDYSKPHDHEVFIGQDKYIQIWYNQRMMYVKASDVIVD